MINTINTEKRLHTLLTTGLETAWVPRQFSRRRARGCRPRLFLVRSSRPEHAHRGPSCAERADLRRILDVGDKRSRSIDGEVPNPWSAMRLTCGAHYFYVVRFRIRRTDVLSPSLVLPSQAGGPRERTCSGVAHARAVATPAGGAGARRGASAVGTTSSIVRAHLLSRVR